MEEIWKDIEGYEGLYQISNMGRVKALKKGIIRKPRLGRGYLYLNLCKNGMKKTFKIHRLVAKAFIPNPQNLKCVNHKDENKLNNVVYNLEWCTFKYNTNYGTSLKRRAETQTRNIYQYDFNGKLIKIWHGLNEVKKSGMSPSAISSCCNKIYKTSYGFIWKYERDVENGG